MVNLDKLPLSLETTLPPFALSILQVDIFTTFQAHLPRLWQIWEMVLLGQPAMVVGLTPSDCRCEP